MDAKKRALDKTNFELGKRIDLMIMQSRQCGIGELIFFLHYLHFTRLIPRTREIPPDKVRSLTLSIHLGDEAFKYAIQNIIKYGDKQYLFTSDGMIIDAQRCQAILKLAIDINSKFEMLYFIKKISKIEVSGERDQDIKMNIEELADYSSENGRYWKYGVRLERNTFDKKRNGISKDEILGQFRNEYAEVEHLFIKQFGLSIDNFVRLIDVLIGKVADNTNTKFPQSDHAIIDVQEYKNIVLFGHCLFIDKDEILGELGDEFKTALNNLIFEPSKFNERELRFNQLARQPIFQIGKQLVVSPEIILDSIILNTHFSLLEAKELHEEYKKSASNKFLDKISKIFTDNGFTEILREFDLWDGKKQIGDIDLGFSDDQGKFILVEAKNHFLPLEVYFRDFDALKSRLNELQTDWENKVIKRNTHLTTNYSKYSIGENFEYIIVTRSPEILTHFSAFKVFDLFELEQYLTSLTSLNDIEEIIDKIYGLELEDMKNEDLSQLEDFSPGITFTKE